MTGRPITEAERILRIQQRFRAAHRATPATPGVLAQLGGLLGKQATVTLTDGSVITGTVRDLTHTDTTVAGQLVTLATITEVAAA